MYDVTVIAFTTVEVCRRRSVDLVYVTSMFNRQIRGDETEVLIYACADINVAGLNFTQTGSCAGYPLRIGGAEGWDGALNSTSSSSSVCVLCLSCYLNYRTIINYLQDRFTVFCRLVGYKTHNRILRNLVHADFRLPA